jgi:spore coat polysaccharide biosynthesis protein SpsF (cytidylyltransferase family)
VDTLNYGKDGIDHSMDYIHNKPWLWSTEFENVHVTWNFEEPRVTIDDREYKDSDTYYKLQKHPAKNDAVKSAWDLKKEDVMRRTVSCPSRMTHSLSLILCVVAKINLLKF